MAVKPPSLLKPANPLASRDDEPGVEYTFKAQDGTVYGVARNLHQEWGYTVSELFGEIKARNTHLTFTELRGGETLYLPPKRGQSTPKPKETPAPAQTPALPPPQSNAAPPTAHTIQRGDSFAKIASHYYTNCRRFYMDRGYSARYDEDLGRFICYSLQKEIEKANPGVSSLDLRPTQVINLPPHDKAVGSPIRPTVSDYQDGTYVPPENGCYYRVKEGESWASILQKFNHLPEAVLLDINQEHLPTLMENPPRVSVGDFIEYFPRIGVSVRPSTQYGGNEQEGGLNIPGDSNFYPIGSRYPQAKFDEDGNQISFPVGWLQYGKVYLSEFFLSGEALSFWRDPRTQAIFQDLGYTPGNLQGLQEILICIAEREGKGFDAISTGRTTDRAFGIMQWNAISPAEDLHGLLKYFKDSDPEAFQRLFAQEAIGVDVDDNQNIYAKGVLLPLRNRTRDSAVNHILSSDWFATVFARAAHDPAFQHAQIRCAMLRLRTSLDVHVGETPITNLVRSNLGRSLLFSEGNIAFGRTSDFTDSSLKELEPHYKTSTPQATLQACLQDPQGEERFLEAFCSFNRGDHQSRLDAILTYYGRSDLK